MIANKGVPNVVCGDGPKDKWRVLLRCTCAYETIYWESYVRPCHCAHTMKAIIRSYSIEQELTYTYAIHTQPWISHTNKPSNNQYDEVQKRSAWMYLTKAYATISTMGLIVVSKKWYAWFWVKTYKFIFQTLILLCNMWCDKDGKS